ncbi:helix-turn-helix domain-containing protein [Kitasatospora griseola]|uniref:helix-turn-helix domain-containing protein n=1 Tax=Kitasatospora griseola TaxID=2064 RepID=UPI0036DE749D
MWLRAQRQARGLTYAAMAKNSTYTDTAFSRATSGATVPTWRLTEAYTRACGADLSRALRLWRKAREADQHRRRQEKKDAAPGGDIAAKLYDVLARKPRLISDHVSLRRAMIGLRAQGGQPSLARLQQDAGRGPNGKWNLPASSLGAILRAEAVPTLLHVTSFVRAMGAGRKEPEWAAAWTRAESSGTVPSTRTWYQAPGSLVVDGDFLSRSVRIQVSIRSVPHPADEPHTDRPTQAGADPAPNNRDTLNSRDQSVLLAHGVFVRDASDNGPLPPLPPAGFTDAGLPIRVPRRRRRWAPRPAWRP